MKDISLANTHAIALITCILIFAAGASAQEEQADISGRWYSNVGNVVVIEVSGNRFTLVVDEEEITAHGTIMGSRLEVALPTRGGEHRIITGRVIDLDRHGRAMRIEWSNGTVLTREVVRRAQQPPEDQPQEIEYVDVKGVWHSNTGRMYEIGQTGSEITMHLVGTEHSSRGTIKGEHITIAFPPPSGKQPAMGRITQISSAGRALFIEWSGGVLLAREPFQQEQIMREEPVVPEGSEEMQTFEGEVPDKPIIAIVDSPETKAKIKERYDLKWEKRIPAIAGPAPISGYKLLQKKDYFVSWK